MPVSIQMPGQTKSPLDAIANALNVVNQVYGIKANSAALDKHASEMKAKEEEMSRMKSNILTPKEVAEYGSKYNVSDSPSKGALSFKVQEGDNVRDIFLTPRPTNESPLLGLDKALKEAELKNKQAELEEKWRKAHPELQSKEDRLRGLGTEGKARYDNANMALTAVRDMSGSLNAGQSTFQLVGDNDFTIARRNFEEALGRMQSGGAIGKEEVKSFRAMAPGIMDSPEIRKKKLAQLEVEMGNRLKTLGFDPEPAPAFVSSSGNSNKSPLIPEAKAAAGGGLTAHDLEALQWVKANPSDPRAKDIKASLALKGIK